MRLSVRRAGVVASAVALALAAGCRQDMHNQPKFVPQRGTDFYADGRSARPQVANTVARTQLHENAYFYTGMVNGKEGEALPFPATLEVLERGQERFNVYCTPCHSRVGNGAGMIVERGYHVAGNLHTARLEAAPLGHFFNVMTNGYGAMPEYSAQVSVEDRWAIAAYIRALQLSQHATQADVPGGAHVEPLTDIEEREGFAPAFAEDWKLPGTVIYATPEHQLYQLPGNGSAPGGEGATAPAKPAAPAAASPNKTAPAAQ
jgi:mono/diheme cytochrome c family protein